MKMIDSLSQTNSQLRAPSLSKDPNACIVCYLHTRRMTEVKQVQVAQQRTLNTTRQRKA